MALPRPSCLRGALGRSTLRKAGQQARSKTFRDVGRRSYATGHEAKKSSDIPWIIGSVAVTVPAATWLLGQAPQKSEHGHDDAHESHGKEEESEGKEEQEEDKSDGGEGKDEGEEKPSEEGSKEENKEESKEESKEDKSDDSSSEDDGKDTPQTSDDEQEYEPPSPGAPGQINKNPRKGPGELQKGDRKPTEKKGEKDV